MAGPYHGGFHRYLKKRHIFLSDNTIRSVGPLGVSDDEHDVTDRGATQDVFRE